MAGPKVCQYWQPNISPKKKEGKEGKKEDDDEEKTTAAGQTPPIYSPSTQRASKAEDAVDHPKYNLASCLRDTLQPPAHPQPKNGRRIAME